MKKKKTQSAIITIDIYNSKFYRLEGGKFNLLPKLKRSKDDTLISYIANSDLIVESIELSSNLPEENLLDIITDKVYEELRLDPAIEYAIYPIKSSLDSNKYQVLIADKNALKNLFSNTAKKVKYIDYILPSPLLYKVLYTTKRLSIRSTDMFIYFGDYDTFITFYHQGEYIYSKSIKFSLNHMYDRFCQLAQEVPLSKEQFRELLENDGLRNAQDSYRELLIKIINECFLTINDVLIYTKRAYELDNIKTAYVGFSWGYITGIESYISNYLNLEGKPISSIYTKEDPKIAIDPAHALMAMSAIELKQGSLELPNLTPYPRPEPFFKRPAGKMILTFIGTIALFLAPIIYDYFVGFTLHTTNVVLEKKASELSAIANRYKSIIKKKQEEIKALDKAIAKTSKIYYSKKGELENVYKKKFNYKLRSEQLAYITSVIKNYNIKSRFIEISDTLYKIEVESKDDKEITAFIKELVKKFNKSISNVDIKNIKFDPVDKHYKGVLKVEFLKDIK